MYLCVQIRLGTRKCWFFRRGKKTRNTRRKISGNKGENRQQTQATYGVDTEIWTRATLVRGNCSHHFPTLPLPEKCSLLSSRERLEIFNASSVVKVGQNEQQETGNLFCDFAVKRVARFSTNIKPLLQQISFLTGLNMGGKTRSIAIELVLQQCCKTSCSFFVARFSAPLRKVHVVFATYRFKGGKISR